MSNKQNKQSISLLSNIDDSKALDDDGVPKNKITCDCTAYCGDDPEVQRGDVSPCTDFLKFKERQEKRTSVKVQLAVFIKNSKAGVLRKLLQDCLELL